MMYKKVFREWDDERLRTWGLFLDYDHRDRHPNQNKFLLLGKKPHFHGNEYPEKPPKQMGMNRPSL